MKKLALFSLLWLLSFVAMPIYAEENDVYFDENYIIISEDAAEDLTTEKATADEDANNVVEENEIVLTVGEEPTIEGTTDLDEDSTLIPEFDISDAFAEEIWEGLSSSNLNPAILALAGWLWLAVWIFCYLLFAYFCLLPISWWEIYRRAGKRGRAWLVPFRGTMVYSEIAGMSKWLWLLPWLWVICTYFVGVLPWDVFSLIMTVLSILTLIWVIVANYCIARRYGWNIFASILHAIIIFMPITALVLGLWNYKYQRKSEEVTEA